MPATTKLVLGGLLLVTAAACGGSSGGGQPGGQSTGGTAPVQHPQSLVGNVGKNDAYTISLSDETGKAITNLAAGSYKLTVHDFSSIHNFHLIGSGANDATSIGEKTTKTYSVTFKPGSYTFVCDSHTSQMTGNFTVT